MGNTIRKEDAPHLPGSKLETRMVEALRQRVAAGPAIRSFNSFLLKFPQIDGSLRNCKATFDQFDEDSNGSIDLEELHKCCHKLDISFTEEETNDLFAACDINQDKGISFNEFIVLLCLIYLLKDDSSEGSTKMRIGTPELETTFETLVNAFIFLDKNKDGYVSKPEMALAIKESGEHFSGQIAFRRFEEMDWDKNGAVSFKEFLFTFTRWVGIDDAEEE